MNHIIMLPGSTHYILTTTASNVLDLPLSHVKDHLEKREWLIIRTIETNYLSCRRGQISGKNILYQGKRDQLTIMGKGTPICRQHTLISGQNGPTDNQSKGNHLTIKVKRINQPNGYHAKRVQVTVNLKVTM